MNHSITIDRVLFLIMAVVILFVTTQRFTGDIPALLSWMAIVIGVFAVE